MVMNVTGWNDLVAGNIFTAIVLIFQSYYGDWFFTILFMSLKALLWFASENMTLEFIFSLVFLTIFISFFDTTVTLVISTIAVFELAAILYNLVFKK